MQSRVVQGHRLLPFLAVVALHAVLLALLFLPRADLPQVIPPVPVQTSIIEEPRMPPAAAPLKPPMLAPVPRAIEVPAALISIPDATPIAATVQPSTPAAAAAATVATAKADPEPVAPPRFDAGYLDNPPPRYPPESRRAHEQGTTLLRVLVSKDGDALQVSVEHSSGSRRLDEAALSAVLRWRFEPARRGAEAVEAWVLVPIEFELRR